jgi:hypothetical protein
VIRSPALPGSNHLTLEPIAEDLDDEPTTRIPALPTRPGSPANRPSGSLGRVLGPLRPRIDAEEPASSISVEPRSDPAAEAAVKRRIESQIQQTLGDRVRSVEVRVTGKSVVLRARAARFWQRRSVRRSLETLPLPAGYRARVESVD